MALKLKICVKPLGNCLGFTVTDETGAYSLQNLGGWGSPNIEISNVINATITIVPPNSANSFTTTVFPILPSNNYGSVNIGTNNIIPTFPDGLYKFTYTIIYNEISGIQQSMSITEEYYNLCNSICCKDKKFAEAVEDKDCDCKCNKVEKAMEIDALIELAKSAACNRDFKSADCLLERIKKLCKNCGC